MSATLDALCKVFDDQLERQETLLAVCSAQGDALRSSDVSALDTRTEAMQALIQETVDSEQQRLALISAVVEDLDLQVEEQTLTGLIAAVADPWRGRMSEFQERIREVLARTQIIVRENHRMMQRSLRLVNRAMGVLLESGPGTKPNYTAEGTERSQEHFPVSMIDQRG